MIAAHISPASITIVPFPVAVAIAIFRCFLNAAFLFIKSYMLSMMSVYDIVGVCRVMYSVVGACTMICVLSFKLNIRAVISLANLLQISFFEQ